MNTKVRDENAGKRPFNHIAGVGRTNRDWWPNQLRLLLREEFVNVPNCKGTRCLTAQPTRTRATAAPV